ncbi:MAG: ABC transporter substrate binding protein [Desulfuromonadaceae bacterium]
MKFKVILWVLLVCVGFVPDLGAAGNGADGKTRFLVVSSYHKEYSWSQETNRGFCAAMLKFGYFDNTEQTHEYTENDYVETSRAIIKKLWMDSKRKSRRAEMEETSIGIYQTATGFKPDLIFLGDDNAANYVGNKFLDAEVPVVFWGVNKTPVKYGLLQSKERPGHNVTGVYQSGYYLDSLKLLKRILPGVQTFAVLSVNTPTGRSHHKTIAYLARQGLLPLELVDIVATNDYEEWKHRALELQQRVDALFLAHCSGLENRSGQYVSSEEIFRWFGENIRVPTVAEQKNYIQQGILCGADDSAYNQGYEAVIIAHDILANGADPATYPPRSPKRGALMVNKRRAEKLGLILTKEMGIEEYIEQISTGQE